MCQYCEIPEEKALNSKNDELIDWGQLVIYLLKIFEIGDEDLIEDSLFSHQPLLESFNANNGLLFFISNSPGENYLAHFREELPKQVIHLQWSEGRKYFAASVYYLPETGVVHTVSRMRTRKI